MKNLMHNVRPQAAVHRIINTIMAVILVATMSTDIGAQCTVTSGTIKGNVYTDINNDGIKAVSESGLSGILVQAYNPNGQVVGSATSSNSGDFTIAGLVDGTKIKLVFNHPTSHSPSFLGANNGSTVQFATVPSCAPTLGLISYGDVCNGETMIVTPCFVQGSTQISTNPSDPSYPNEPSLVGIKYGFSSLSPATKIASHGETGSVWGVAHKSSTNEIFSSSFVKQLVALKDGHDAIFKSTKSGTTYTTNTFAKLSNLGQTVGSLTETNVETCIYGAQVGKIGLGSLIISPDERFLYTVNLYNNTLVRIPTTSPSATNTVNYTIPNPQCSNNEYRAFALKYYDNKIYVGVTCTAETSANDANSSANVYEFNPTTGAFTLVFTTTFLKGYWKDNVSVGVDIMQWLTDIDFTDDGNMVLAFSDRVGHMYCNGGENRLDEQKGDILLVWKNNGVWTLENNGTAGSLTGSLKDTSLYGPGGGEFFGADYFVSNPTYHPELALGGAFVLPGTNSVIVPVFDPGTNTYSGGLHRYDTRNGSLLGFKELYTRSTLINLGKATGFGDVIALCAKPEIEIGNLVWYDSVKNGIQDAGENPISGLTLNLYDAACRQIGTTVTNANGQYVFNSTNVSEKIKENTQYFVGVSSTQKDALTNSFVINNAFYKVTSNNGSDVVNSDASSTALTCSEGLVSVRTSQTSHNFDIGLIDAGACSAKITSTILNQNGGILDPVRYQIKYENNGGTVMKGFGLKNVLPQGMTFDASENLGWVNNNGTLEYTFEGNLLPLRSINVDLVLRYNIASPTYSFTNTTSICRIKDANNVWNTDIQGCLDDDNNAVTSSAPTICDLSLMLTAPRDQVVAKNANVTMTARVCNQGTKTATDLTIVNYRNDEFDFDPALNRGWVIAQDLATISYAMPEDLLVGECREVNIIYTIKDDLTLNEIVNYAEIMSHTCEGVTNKDFDSTPDNRKTNDKGGQPNTSTDNEMNDHGDVDEDDHDPVILGVNTVDFSLRKTVQSHRVRPTQLVTFNIAITNQGDVAASRMVLTDYIPEYFTLEDNNWTKVGANAQRTITFPGNLLPGATYNTQILMRVAANAPIPFTMTNYAEITEVYDPAGRNISNTDVDSRPDNVKDLSAEDDISNVPVVLMGVVSQSSCVACIQGTTPDNGQFKTTIVIASQAGETWEVEQSQDLFTTSGTILAPVLMPEGFTLTESAHPTPGHSYYTLMGRHVQGKGYSVRLKNDDKFGDHEQIEVGTQACGFTTLDISGPQSLCAEADAEYFAEVDGDEEVVAWYINGTLVGTSESIEVDWTLYGLGTHTITAISPSNCTAPINYEVNVGNVNINSISCISNLNISLDGDCEIKVTPTMILAGAPDPGIPYIVMVLDPSGQVIPGALVTKQYIGKKLTAKVIDGCGGNSCWSTILIEDKLAPMTNCRDIELPCFQLDEYEGPFESDNCGGPITVNLVSETITPLDCDDDFVKLVNRSYQAVDASGNKSAICNMTISLERPDTNYLTFPHGLMMSNDSALICSDTFPLDEYGNPHPSYTGVPKLGKEPIFPNSNPICNLYAGYSDEKFVLGCVTKILRKWVVIEEHCSVSNIVTRNQIIEITDTIAPVITPIPNQTISTNGSQDCEGDITIVRPQVVDGCNTPVEVKVEYPGGFINNITSNRRVTLPAGEHLIVYTATDACGNASSSSYLVTIEDATAPTMVCVGNTAIGLNSNGEAILYPRHLDAGSFDGCGLGDKFIALMRPNVTLRDTAFKESLRFTCADAGRTFTVVLRVFDTQGNSNSCMVSVEVQDKTIPSISCPSSVVVQCDQVDNDSDLKVYGTATGSDACDVTVRELTAQFNLSSCRVGYIIRAFEATDGTNIDTCQQRIYVENNNVWDPETGLVESEDFDVTDMCNVRDLDPENLPAGRGYPEIIQGPCSMVAATYEDDVYNIVQGACMKIYRKWTVIDWCQMEIEGDDYEPYEFSQIIKILNTKPPTFKTTHPERDTVYAEPGNCIEAPFEGVAIARDDCPSNLELQWSYTIDYGNNGTIDVTEIGFDTIINLEELLPLGESRIVWSFEDRCGNVTSRVQVITAINNDKPTVAPLSTINVAIQPWDTNGDNIADIEKACIYASSLDASSEAACCEDPLTFSFSADPTDTVRCFDCFDVGQANPVQFWAHDCYGNSDFVVVNVNVQDNNNSDICATLCNNNTPTVTITPPANTAAVCSGSPITLTANATYPVGASNTNSIYLWSTGATTRMITVNPTVATTYTVTVSNQTGCFATATRVVNILPPPTITITGGPICVGQTAQVLATGGGTYLWSTGATTAQISVSPPATQTYTVTVTSPSPNFCTGTASRQVVVNIVPAITIDPAVAPSICPGQSSQLMARFLTAGVTGTYSWSTGATAAQITVSPASTTTYTVTATSNGCTNTAQKVVTILPPPTVVISGADAVCTGGSTTLTASGGGTYLWNTGATTAALSTGVLNVTTPFSVTVTGSNGCTATATRTVTVTPVPTVTISPNAASVCFGSSTNLTATGGGTYSWNVGGTNATITTGNLTTPTTFVVTVTAAGGCSSTASRQVTINPLPTPAITGATPVCLGGSMTLTATPATGVTYLWGNGMTTNQITITPANSTNIAVTVTNTTTTCSAATSVSITVNPLPSVNAGPDAGVCIGLPFTNNATVTGNGPFTYLWTSLDAGGSFANAAIEDAVYTGTTPGIKRLVLQATSAQGCIRRDTMNLTVDPGTLTCTTQNITAYLGTTGSVTITPMMISTSNMGACANITASVAPNMFFCNDALPPNNVYTVTLTLTNNSTTPPQTASCTAQVTVRDSIRPTITCPPNQSISCAVFNPTTNLGTATASDNCSAGLTILGPVVINNINQCNIGTITRTFTARDLSLNTRSCVQVVTITNPNPLTLANISFPPDITVTNCQGVTPAVTGNTTVTPPVGSCTDLSITFLDDAPTANPLCRDTINRTWRVVDSCQLVAGTQNGIFTRVQRIIVTVPAPVITAPATVTLYATPATGCQGVLGNALSLFTATGCNLVLSNTRNALPSFNINGTYPVGTTSVTLTARETCLNQTVNRVVQIIVLDTTFTDLACVKTFPKMLDTNPPIARDTASNHAVINVSCASPGAVHISFNRLLIGDSIRLYDCEDLLIDFTIKVYMWVNGVVVDSCTTIATPVDPNDHCTNNFGRIAGNVTTEAGQKVPQVNMDLQGANITNPITNMDGKYNFPTMPLGGEYTLVPNRNNNPMEGVSTLDLIMIQRHILKLQTLNTPYKIIAADVNKDNKISASDIVDLRKLILGIYETFPSNTSWRMVDDKHTFVDPNNPFLSPLSEAYYIPALSGSMLLNWIGVKVGDVNGSYVTNINDNDIESRSTVRFVTDDKALADGSNSIVISADAATSLTGFQMAIKVQDATNIIVKSRKLNITPDQYTVTEDGTVIISWSNKNAMVISKSDALFEITFDGRKAEYTSDVVSLTNTIKGELYDMDLNTRGIELRFADAEVRDFAIIGNSPNPWQASTELKFYTPEAGNVMIRVRDIAGRLVYEKSITSQKGINSIQFKADELGSIGGVLITELIYGNQKLTHKMLQIK